MSGKVIALIRILYGALFVASAVLKLFPIDYFELILVEQVGVPWSITPLVARTLIIVEFAIGIALATGVLFRWSWWASVLLLSAFSLYLVIQILLGHGGEDCGCFGQLIPLDGPSSLVKNLLILAVAALLWWQRKIIDRYRIPIVGWILIIGSLPAMFLIYPLPVYSEDADFEIDKELLDRSAFESDESMGEGNKVVVIMMARCIHCAQLGTLISTLSPSDVENDLRIIVLGTEDDYLYFVRETGLSGFQHVRSTDHELVRAVEGTFPTVVHITSGEVQGKWNGRDVNIRLLGEILALD